MLFTIGLNDLLLTLYANALSIPKHVQCFTISCAMNRNLLIYAPTIRYQDKGFHGHVLVCPMIQHFAIPIEYGYLNAATFNGKL
jgi:hypothetical protein